MKKKIQEIIDDPILIGVITLMALLCSMWETGFFNDIC